MSNKALFAIREIKSGKLLSQPMFEDKQLAKEHRRNLNAKNKEGQEILDHVVTYGPDHDKFEARTAHILVVKAKEQKQDAIAGTDTAHIAAA